MRLAASEHILVIWKAAQQEPMMNTVKESLLEIAARLSDECKWDEVMYQIYVRQKIEAGLVDIAEGRTLDHNAVFEEFAK